MFFDKEMPILRKPIKSKPRGVQRKSEKTKENGKKQLVVFHLIKVNA